MSCQHLKSMEKAIENGNVLEVRNLIKVALDKGCRPEVILQDGLLKSIDNVSEKFKNKQIFVPDLLLATRAGNAGISYLSSELPLKAQESFGRIIIGTIRGDLHDIGKNMVKIFFEIAGFEVIDLGTDVPVEGFIDAAKKYDPQIIGLSAALTTTMYGMKDVIRALEQDRIRDKHYVMVGGVPITSSFARGIGADIFDPDGTSAVIKAKGILKCANF